MNPIRKSICDLAKPERRFAEHHGAIRLLIIGGSRGAAIFNELLPKAIALLPENTELNIWHQTGANNRGIVIERYSDLQLFKSSNENDSLKIEEFITDMDAAYQWADIALCRSGALTVSELAAAGLGAILVPFPHAVDDHQTANANYLVSADAAEIIQQSELDAEKLAKTINQLANRERCLEMAVNAKTQAKVNATQEVADFCIKAAGLGTRRRAA